MWRRKSSKDPASGRGTTGYSAASSAGERRADEPRVVVYSKPGCHLCEVALGVVAQVCAERGTTWCERDISQDAELMRTFGEQIPVTFVDGRQHDFFRVDPDRLRGALG